MTRKRHYNDKDPKKRVKFSFDKKPLPVILTVWNRTPWQAVCLDAELEWNQNNMNDQENKQTSPQTEEFLAWYEKEKAKGLVDVKFFPKNVQGATVESFLAEVNEATKAQTVNRPDFF
jgi:hypothetical protein